MTDFEIEPQKVGTNSSYGDVYFATRKTDGLEVAIKFNNGLTDELIQRFQRENDILHDLKPHHGIVKPLSNIISNEAFSGKSRDFYIMARTNSSLAKWLYNISSSDLNKKVKIFVQICEAVNYAHTKGYIHRDLHFENILMDILPVEQIKLIDFGRAYDFNSDRRLSEGPAWGDYVMPPEVRFGVIDQPNRTHYVKGDVYALGVILKYIILSDYSSILLLQSINNTIRQEIHNQFSTNVLNDYHTNQPLGEKKKVYKKWLGQNAQFLNSFYSVDLTDQMAADQLVETLKMTANFDASKRTDDIEDVIKSLKGLY